MGNNTRKNTVLTKCETIRPADLLRYNSRIMAHMNSNVTYIDITKYRLPVKNNEITMGTRDKNFVVLTERE
jgi:hypothetical protein